MRRLLSHTAPIRRHFSSLSSRCIQLNTFSPSLKNLLEKNGVEVAEDEFQQELNQPILANLHARGLIETCVNEPELEKAISGRKLGLYCGADPTAGSLHLGNLLPLMILLHFNIHGHNIYPLVGGATGAVGDPSGRTTERDPMAENRRVDNLQRISAQFVSFFERGLDYAQSRNPAVDKTETGTRTLQNNYDWWKDMGMLEFLAKYGRYIRVSQMLGRDSIKNRLSSDQGIGFNEFTYQVLQAYDFYYLNKSRGVDVQVGGRDQYGNIVAGIDLISRLQRAGATEKDCFGITVPLLTTAAGVKFGKSAGNAIFIDKQLTPSYSIYQFMYRTEDADVQRFLYKFSLLPVSVIDKVVAVHNADKKRRFGQRVLAMEMCDLIHGDGEGYNNSVISKTLYSSEEELDTSEVIEAFKSQGMVTEVKREELESTTVPNLLFTLSKGAHSKGEYKRMIKGGSVSIGRDKKDKVRDANETISTERLIDGRLLLLRAGKEYYIAEVV